MDGGTRANPDDMIWTDLCIEGVESVPVMSLLQSSRNVGRHLTDLLTPARKLDVRRLHRAMDAGLEADEYAEVLESLQTVASCYDTETVDMWSAILCFCATYWSVYVSSLTLMIAWLKGYPVCSVPTVCRRISWNNSLKVVVVVLVVVIRIQAGVRGARGLQPSPWVGQSHYFGGKH